MSGEEVQVLGERTLEDMPPAAAANDSSVMAGLDTSTLEFSVENLDGLVVQNLTQLWATLGLDPAATSERLRELSTALRNVYAIELQRTKGEIRLENGRIQDIAQQIQQFSRELSDRNVDGVDLPDLDDSSPLLPRSHALQEQLSKLEIKRASILKHLREKQERVIHLYTIVLGERVELLGARFRELSDDISLQWEKELDTELHHLETFVVERQEFVPNVLRRIAVHLDKLGGSESDSSSQVDAAARALALGKLDTATLGVTRNTVDAISSRETVLTEEMASRETRIQTLREAANELAASQRIPQEEWDAFTSAHNSCKLDDLQAYVSKIDEMTAARHERLEFLIKEASEKLDAIHDEIHSSPERKEADREALASDQPASEERLAIYERKIADLEKKAAVVRPIFDLLTKRAEARGIRDQLAEERKDVNRLYTATGRLDNAKIQREEKLLKKCRNLPRIEADLIKKLKQFEKENNTAFSLDDVPLLETIHNENRKDEQAKRDAKVRQKAQLEREVRYGTAPTPTRGSNSASHRIATRQATPAAKVRSTLRESNAKSPSSRVNSKSRLSGVNNIRTPTKLLSAGSLADLPSGNTPAALAGQGRPSLASPVHLSMEGDETENHTPTKRSTAHSSPDTIDCCYSDYCDSDEIGESSTVQDLAWQESPIPSRIGSDRA